MELFLCCILILKNIFLVKKVNIRYLTNVLTNYLTSLLYSNLDYSEYDENPLNTLDQLEMTLFALQSWSLIPVYAVPEVDDSDNPDLVVGKHKLRSSFMETRVITKPVSGVQGKGGDKIYTSTMSRMWDSLCYDC